MSTATAALTLVSFFAAAGAAVDLGGLKSNAPVAWKETPVSNPMRIKQFTVPGKEGDAELVIFFFGQGQGGDVPANLDRWRQQFEPAAAGQAPDPGKVTTMKLAAAKVTVLDLRGTYKYKARPMDPGPGEPRPNHRMLGVVFESPKGNYFIRLVGPAKTVDQSKKDFDGWLKAFK